MKSIPLLLAAEMWEVVIGILFFVLYGVGQLLAGKEEAKRKEKKPAKPRPAPRKKRAAPDPFDEGLARRQPVPVEREAPVPPREQTKQQQLRSEVEEFMNRAKGRSQASQPPPQRKTPSRPQPPRRSSETDAVVVEAVPAPVVDLRRETIGGHVTRHLSSEDLTEQLATMGHELEQTDERLEAHLQERFDHQLGTLRRQEEKIAEVAKVNLANDLIAMLSDPADMRKVIVASEILRRPEL